MKWYGWGAEGEGFDPTDRPYLRAFVREHLGIENGQQRRPPVPLSSIALPPMRRNAAFLECLAGLFPPARWSLADHDRLLHAYGKSTRDLWRIRHGRVDVAPDCVIYPESETEICALLAAADRHDVAIIPFGGGTNVAGCLEPHLPSARMVASVNLRLMNRVLEIDRTSRTVRVQAGILGPDLERALDAAGLTLGHLPDSFLYSTIGGWIATRSSGMLSDGYGNIEDMVLALRMATPSGMVKAAEVPRASSGPDPAGLCVGSEGTLGVITEALLCVSEKPQRREFRAYLFGDFGAGVAAVRECNALGCRPVLTRLNDAAKTQLTAAFRRQRGAMSRAVSRVAKAYIAGVRRFDLDACCLLIAAFEGDDRAIRARRRSVERVYRAHGAVGLGRGPGEAFAESKFDFPHIRDLLMDYDAIADVGETSTTWARLPALCAAATEAYGAALGAGGRRYWLGCHLSHSYHAGATLYFTFAFQCRRDAGGNIDAEAELAHYLSVKRAGLDCFAAQRATLSHHHAVGYEHLPWLYGENPVGTGTLIDAVKPRLDPHDIMNPGKLRSGYTIDDWSTGLGGRMPASSRQLR